jgi:hypothetical protein
MRAVFLLEEPSAEALLQTLLPKLLPAGMAFDLVVFQGKKDLLANLSARLKGYKKWLPPDWRIVVLLDEDREDCRALKGKVEKIAHGAGFATKAAPDRQGRFTVLSRIAVEEIEAWYFGDVPALASAYPGISPTLGSKAAYRDPDAIAGGTWEALERVLKRAGHFTAGLSKIELARTMAAQMDPARNTSASFRCFRDGLSAL